MGGWVNDSLELSFCQKIGGWVGGWVGGVGGRTDLEVEDGAVHLLLVEAPEGVVVLLHGRTQDGKHGHAACW